MSGEHWSPEHDDEHEDGELACAAACYATPPDRRDPPFKTGQAPLLWPWQIRDWKPGDRLRELVKAGALLAAEIDRWKRAFPAWPGCGQVHDGVVCTDPQVPGTNGCCAQYGPEVQR